MQRAQEAATSFVSEFARHHRRCLSLAKRFATDDPNLKDSAALGQLCRATQEMLEQAKAARALSEIYLRLDERHRDAVQAIIIARFEDILESAQASWRRFCDSMQFVHPDKREIESARRQFEPQADRFQDTLRKFVALADKTT
jgi:hypothetical protein